MSFFFSLIVSPNSEKILNCSSRENHKSNHRFFDSRGKIVRFFRKFEDKDFSFLSRNERETIVYEKSFAKLREYFSNFDYLNCSSRENHDFVKINIVNQIVDSSTQGEKSLSFFSRNEREVIVSPNSEK